MGQQILETEAAQEVVWQPQEGPQEALITCPVSVILYGGARGGGKSDGILGKWLAHIYEASESPATRGHANGVIFRLTLTEIEELIERSKAIFGPIGAVYRSGSKTWIFPGGDRLKFRYLKRIEDVAKYQGHQYTYIAIEEAGNWLTELDGEGQPTQSAIKMLRATMRSPVGIRTLMVLTANPGGVGHAWLLKFFIDKSEPFEPFQSPVNELNAECVFIPARLEDNKILMKNDPDYEAKLMAAGGAELIEAWRWGNWKIRPKGNIINVDQLKRYELPQDKADWPKLLPQFNLIWDTWDTAFKEKTQNDRTCGIKWGVTENAIYILDFVAKRKEYPQMRQEIIDLHASYIAHEVLIEDKASGQSVIQDLRQNTKLPIVPVQVPSNMDKVQKANTITPLISAGRVYIPTYAIWLKDLLDELSIFPKGSHDDAVDAFVIGLRRFLFGMPHTGLMDFYRQQFQKMKEQQNAKR